MYSAFFFEEEAAIIALSSRRGLLTGQWRHGASAHRATVSGPLGREGRLTKPPSSPQEVVEIGGDSARYPYQKLTSRDVTDVRGRQHGSSAPFTPIKLGS